MILLNGIEVKPTIFSDKTSQVWKLEMPNQSFCEIEWRFESESELMHLAQLRALVDLHFSEVSLCMPYLPYARQDKEISNDSTFALRIFAELINEMNFHKVSCFDPHSDVADALFNNFDAHYPTFQVGETYEFCSAQAICFPDAGASKKYSKFFSGYYPTISAEKTRDQSTGTIVDYKLIGKVPRNVLIVDDICDGGTTFILLAKGLKENGAFNIDLFVSHGIFSKGTEILRAAGISRIFTKDGEVK